MPMTDVEPRTYTKPLPTCPSWCKEHATETVTPGPSNGLRDGDPTTWTQHRRTVHRHYFEAQRHNWPSGDPPNPANGAAPTLKVDAVPGDKVKAHVVAGDLGGQHIFVALTENGYAAN